jgi:hypothetical protein
MPLYLVRWPELVAALVSAADEDDLLHILDETANPEGCTWSVYRGPLCIEFSLNAESEIEEASEPRERPLEPANITLGDVARICERNLLSANIPADSETAHAMVQEITRKAFPVLHQVVDTARETLPEKEVRTALRQELDALLRASWQHQQTKRRGDPASVVAAMMGTSPRLVTHWTKPRAEAKRRKDKARPSPNPSRPRGKGKPKKPK